MRNFWGLIRANGSNPMIEFQAPDLSSASAVAQQVSTIFQVTISLMALRDNPESGEIGGTRTLYSFTPAALGGALGNSTAGVSLG